MKINHLQQIITECFESVLEERQKKQKVATALKKLVMEVIEEKKANFEKTCLEIQEELDKEVKKIDKKYSVVKNDAGNFEMCGCDPHHIFVRPRWYNNFEVLAFKNKTDRTKKIGLSYDEVKEFLKATLNNTDQNYVNKAYNKAAENSVDKEKKKNQGDGPQKTDVKVEDAVEKKEDLPDQPMQDVNLKKVEKQVDHSVKGEKPKYKFPKQKDDDLTVKFK